MVLTDLRAALVAGAARPRGGAVGGGGGGGVGCHCLLAPYPPGPLAIDDVTTIKRLFLSTLKDENSLKYHTWPDPCMFAQALFDELYMLFSY